MRFETLKMNGFVLLILLAPCPWGSYPDSQPHKLIVNYSMMILIGQKYLIPTGLAVVDRDKGQSRCGTDRLKDKSNL